ncbi:MAG TPA: V-type ATPase 116kDa subunit family protein [Nitrososphaera sp.]|jgi:V/A-type H+-transporting ATPase subunit I|nr:V-type ATPase 116kDa subunit family protein [Nitrososphaera sp.]
MGLAKLKKAALILPRIETQEAVSKLAELEWFHPIQSPSEHLNPFYDDLLLKAQRLFQEIDEVVRALGVPLETGVMATMFKGAPKEKTDYVIDDIQDFIADLEDKSKPLLEEPKKILAEQNMVAKNLEEYSTIAAALKMASTLNIDLTSFGKLRMFYADIFVIDSKDEAEIRKSLGEDMPIHSSKLVEEKTALVVIGAREDSERVTKVMRSFGVHPLLIPAGMPQKPSEAYAQAQAKSKELEAKSAELTKAVDKTRKTMLAKILSLHEAARIAKDVLEITRKPGGTKNFALIQGYIPEKMEGKFKKLTSDYVSVITDTHFDPHEVDTQQPLPSLLTNKSYTRTFEVITETQGLPRYDEIDPTPIIAFVWPLFYGLMFGDLGHGLLLFGLGFLLRHRGTGSLRTWGTLIAASGAAASIAGLGTGEMFGFHINELSFLAPIFAPLHGIVGVLNVSELSFDQVIKILKVSVAIGIVHLLMAYGLKLYKNIKEGNKLLIYTHDIPAIIQFLAVVALILAAIGSGYDIIGMFGISGNIHTEFVPWISFVAGDWVTVDVVAKAAPPVLFATVGIMIYGGMKEQEIAKKHGHDEGSGLMGIVIEVILVRIIEVLSNVISYTRIGIMLLVHAALLVTVNQSYEHGGGIAVLIGGNIGIMLIEGLIVYIQTIRLHLYEWFPKWYGGDGTEFRKIVPRMLYSNLIWRDPRIPLKQK